MGTIKDSLTFDDVSLIPQYSAVTPNETQTSVDLHKNLNLKIPLISSAMDTVTESKMALTIAKLGGIGIIVGGILALKYINIWDWVGNMITRFSGVTLCCIMTGVIWIGEPESFMDVLLYDNLHVLLWVGALFFALRGNNS